jgi:DNA-binding Xre family transcriptional regulator
MGEVRNRGVSPSKAGLRQLTEAMADKCWNSDNVAGAVNKHTDVTIDKKTVDRFLQKDPKNPRVDQPKAQAICKVLELKYSEIIEADKAGQLETDKPNPFTYGLPVSADRFYGRDRTIADLKSRIGAKSPQCVNLVGLRRSGKTSMLHYIQAKPEAFFAAEQNPLIVNLDLQNGRYHSPIGLLSTSTKLTTYRQGVSVNYRYTNSIKIR